MVLMFYSRIRNHFYHANYNFSIYVEQLYASFETNLHSFVGILIAL
jgi:hypothetical protein